MTVSVSEQRRGDGLLVDANGETWALKCRCSMHPELGHAAKPLPAEVLPAEAPAPSLLSGSPASGPPSGAGEPSDPPPAARPSRSASGRSSGVTTKGRKGRHRRRSTAFVEPRSGLGVTDGGGSFRVASGGGLAGILAGLPESVERVYLTGPRPGRSLEDWETWRSAIPDGWTDDPAGHFLERPDFPVLKFRSPAGVGVEVHRIVSWIGRDATDAGPAVCRDALGLVDGALRRQFRDCPGVLATPATTGRECWLSSIPYGVEWPVLTVEDRQLLHATAGQGRVEVAWSGGAELPGLFVYDGRMMYGALLREMGSGPAVRDTLPDFEPYRPGRYRVRFRIPDDWDHVGLLGVPDGERWAYPAEPGSEHETWADGAELHLAAARGWSFRVLERLLLAHPDGRGPLQTWGERLVRAREQLAGGGPEHDLARAAIRQVMHTTIGAFHARPHLVTRTAPLDEPGRVPAGAVHPHVRGDRLVWSEPSGGGWEQLAHPEWSSQVWGRARRRILAGPGQTGALYVQREHLVGTYVDAVYATHDPRWGDDGKLGRLRLKAAIAGPLRAPRHAGDMTRLGKGKPWAS